jgi:hypothetical protein
MAASAASAARLRALPRPAAADRVGGDLAPLLLAAVWYGFPWIDLVAAIARRSWSANGCG